MASRNIIVCGDLSGGPLVVLVSDPKQSTIADIKKQVEKIVQVPARELTLYLNEKLLPDDKAVHDCDGLGNGVAILAAIKPVILTVYRAGAGVSVEIKIPKREFPNWTVNRLMEITCFKFLLNPDSPHILASQGIKLERNKPLSKFLSDDNVVTLTPLKHIKMVTSGTTTAIPAFCCLLAASQNVFYSRDLVQVESKNVAQPVQPSTIGYRQLLITQTISHPSTQWLEKWYVILQQFSGTKTKLTVSNPRSTTVHSFREQVKATLSIPTHQQKLVVGDVILEDWDEQGKVMLLANYPTLHDGATVCVVQLTEGISIMHDAFPNEPLRWKSQQFRQLQVSEQNAVDAPNTIPIDNTVMYNHINVPSTREFSIEKLYKIFENLSNCQLAILSTEKLFVNNVSITRSSATLDTLKSTIVHKCTLSTSSTQHPKFFLQQAPTKIGQHL